MTPEELAEIRREVDDELCLFSQHHYRRRIRQLLEEVCRLRDWNETALRIGEMLADTGPNGYYDFDPATWAAWCDGRIRQLQSEVKWFRDAVSILGFDAPGGDGVNPLKERLAELLRASVRPPAAHTPDPPPAGQTPSQ